MYTFSSGTTHSVQHAIAALMEVACSEAYNFLDTMGSTQQGVRICTSFFSDNLRDIFCERIEIFNRNESQKPKNFAENPSPFTMITS